VFLTAGRMPPHDEGRHSRHRARRKPETHPHTPERRPAGGRVSLAVGGPTPGVSEKPETSKEQVQVVELTELLSLVLLIAFRRAPLRGDLRRRMLRCP
jgi:hypothetical protein